MMVGFDFFKWHFIMWGAMSIIAIFTLFIIKISGDMDKYAFKFGVILLIICGVFGLLISFPWWNPWRIKYEKEPIFYNAIVIKKYTYVCFFFLSNKVRCQ